MIFLHAKALEKDLSKSWWYYTKRVSPWEDFELQLDLRSSDSLSIIRLL